MFVNVSKSACYCQYSCLPMTIDQCLPKYLFIKVLRCQSDITTSGACFQLSPQKKKVHFELHHRCLFLLTTLTEFHKPRLAESSSLEDCKMILFGILNYLTPLSSKSLFHWELFGDIWWSSPILKKLKLPGLLNPSLVANFLERLPEFEQGEFWTYAHQSDFVRMLVIMIDHWSYLDDGGYNLCCWWIQI